MKTGIKILVGSIGIIIWAILIERVGFWNIIDELWKVGWDGIMVILIPYCLILYFDTLSWKVILEGVRAGKKVSQRKLGQVKLIGDTVNNIVPAGGVFGDMIKWSLLKRNGVSWIEGVSSIYVVRITMAQGELLYVVFGVISFFFNFRQRTREGSDGWIYNWGVFDHGFCIFHGLHGPQERIDQEFIFSIKVFWLELGEVGI